MWISVTRTMFRIIKRHKYLFLPVLNCEKCNNWFFLNSFLPEILLHTKSSKRARAARVNSEHTCKTPSSRAPSSDSFNQSINQPTNSVVASVSPSPGVDYKPFSNIMDDDLFFVSMKTIHKISCSWLLIVIRFSIFV